MTNVKTRAMMDAGDVADLHRRLRELSRHLDDLLDAAAPFPTDTDEARQRLTRAMGSSADVCLVSVVAQGPESDVLVAYIDGIVDSQRVAEAVVRPLGHTTAAAASWPHNALASAGVKAEARWSELLSDLTKGSTLIFANGLAHAWVADTAKYVQRDVTRPQTELAVRGPEQAFIEVLSVQKAQLRQALGGTALRFTDLHVGRTAQNTVAVAHLAGVTNPSLVDTVVGRIQQIDVAGISTSTQVAGLIRDHPRSIFPTIRATERVDVATWHILQGGAAVLTNGDPFVLLAPAPLVAFYRTAMDYSTSWADAAFTRLIRLISWGLGLYLPAVYVALAEVNPNLLPTSLFIMMQGGHSGLPFSPLMEIVLMIVVIEVLREAAIRLPKVLSTTIGTVGAIVVGTAVVRAGIIDSQIIVLMTLTALALFATPTYELTGAWRLIGFLLLLGAVVLGVLGIVLTTVAVLAVLLDMASFGVPYFAPGAPFRGADWSDSVWRVPWTAMRGRRTEARPSQETWRVPPSARTPTPRLHRAQGRRGRREEP